jgi:phospholipase C
MAIVPDFLDWPLVVYYDEKTSYIFNHGSRPVRPHGPRNDILPPPCQSSLVEQLKSYM